MSEPAPLTDTGKFKLQVKSLLGLPDNTPDDSVLARVRSLVYTIKQIKITDADILKAIREAEGNFKRAKEKLLQRIDAVDNEVQD